jgi:predicted ATPase
MIEVIAATLGVAPLPDLSLDAAIVKSLRGRSLLLLMDNCEHLLDAVGRLIDAILRSCADVRVLATSREGLAVAGEHVVPLRSLPVPETNASSDVVASCEAVRLFVQRADAARSGFAIDASNANAVAEICRRLDGVPLAIELAAARTGAMTPSEIARLLDERFRLLTGGRRTAVERHQTLRATVEWSYSLLDEREQTVFDRLGVFVGGFNASAASAVAGADGLEAWDVLDALDGLVAKSMLQADETEDGTMRFSMLDTLRAYAREQLDASGDADEWRRRHAGHYASVAEEVREGMLGLAPRPAFVQFRSEIDNTRAAVDWALDSENEQDPEFAVRIVAALGPRVVSYAPWADRVLDRAPRLHAPQRASLLLAASVAAFERGDEEAAAGLAREAIDLGLTVAFDLSYAHIRLARIEALKGRTDAAFATIADARAALARLAPDPAAEAMLGMATAQILAFTGDPTAPRKADEVLQKARASGQFLALVGTLGIVAEINALEDPGTAARAAEESLTLQRLQGETVWYGRVLALATLLRVRKGDSSGALTALREAIFFHAERGTWSGTYPGMAIAALTLDSLGELHAAAAIAACVAAGPMAPQRMIPLHEQHAERDVLRRIRATIGANEYDDLFADAADLSSDLAVARALTVIDDLIATRGDD